MADEGLQVIFNKGNLACRLTEEERKQIDDNYELLTGKNEYVSDKDFIKSLVDRILNGRREKELTEKLKKANEEIAQISLQKGSVSEQIKAYEQELGKVKEALEQLRLEGEKMEESYKKEVFGLKSYVANQENEMQSAKLKENQVLLTLNNPKLNLVNAYLKADFINSFFDKMNQAGKMDGFIENLKSPDNKTNIANMLVNIFICQAMGYQLKTVFSEKSIKEAFESYIKNNK